MNKFGINQLLNKKANPDQSWPLNKDKKTIAAVSSSHFL